MGLVMVLFVSCIFVVFVFVFVILCIIGVFVVYMNRRWGRLENPSLDRAG